MAAFALSLPSRRRLPGADHRIEVYLWLGVSGIPEHIAVKRAAGLGLNEAPMAAVAQHRFKPATQNGLPVRVDLYVDVNSSIR